MEEKEKLSISGTTAAADKPYHPKRPHRKTRTGCRNCKTRKVKCDEARPACRSCTVRKETCVYLAAPRRARPTSPSTASSPDKEPAGPLALAARCASTVPQQPLFIPGGHSELDMRLLWFYTTATYTSFSTGGLRERNVDVILKVNVVQHAFANPFLMNAVLGLAAMHINHLGIHHMGVTRSQEIRYRANAFETYRKAVGVADPATFPALLACSLLLCGLSTHVFRGEDAQPLSILHWMGLWKGISTIIQVTELPELVRSGIAALIARPKVDMDASARCLPNYLLFMIASVKEGDPDFGLVQDYYKALQFLGSLYLELGEGFSQRLMLRICTFPTFLPHSVVDAARQKRPRALVIFAHYLVFIKFRINSCWWMDNISDLEIPSINRYLGPEWHHLLRVPMAALQMENDRDIVRLLLDDPAWDKPITLKDEGELLTSDCERELAIRAARQANGTTKVRESQDEMFQFRGC